MNPPRQSIHVGVRWLLRHPAGALALGFGIGLVPWAPGTFGSVLGVAAFLPIAGWSPWAYGVLLVVLTVIGVFACGQCQRLLGVGDHPAIVWDEVVGMLLTLWAVPATWSNIAVGFLLFRLFDIVKPWPIRVADRRIKGGLGIMLDDLLAGACAWLVVQLWLRMQGA